MDITSNPIKIATTNKVIKPYELTSNFITVKAVKFIQLGNNLGELPFSHHGFLSGEGSKVIESDKLKRCNAYNSF